jgi:hypothetical protein
MMLKILNSTRIDMVQMKIDLAVLTERILIKLNTREQLKI